jgi:1,4-alpha-glucan branching enzyme
LEADNRDESVFAFMRQRLPGEGGTHLLIIFNCTPVPRDGYIFGAPHPGRYRKLIDSDAAAVGGSAYHSESQAEAYPEPWREFPARIRVTLPPLAMVVWVAE